MPALMTALLLTTAASGWAADYHVNTTFDSCLGSADDLADDGTCLTADGTCTLRAAVQQAARSSEQSTIVLEADATYELACALEPMGDVVIMSDACVDNPSACEVGQGPILDGLGQTRHFIVRSADTTLTLRSLKLTKGSALGQVTCNESGGAICIEAGAAVLDRVVLEANVARTGGALYGNATLLKATVRNNRATLKGGGLHCDGGALVVKETVLDGNAVARTDGVPQGEGGGIAATNCALDVEASSIFAREVPQGVATRGGGLLVDGGTGIATLVNTTVSGNKATQAGGGIAVDCEVGFDPCLILNNVTVARNEAPEGAGLWAPLGRVTVRNTILASNAPDQCHGAVVSDGHNLVGSRGECSGWLFESRTLPDFVAADPGLGGLSLGNGGRTFTHALEAGSPAIDRGNPVTCAQYDQTCAPDGSLQPAGRRRACDMAGIEGAPSVQECVRCAEGGEDEQALPCDPCDIGAYERFQDSDADCAEDHVDNCPGKENRAQVDSDGDGLGDACDECREEADERRCGCEADAECGRAGRCENGRCAAGDPGRTQCERAGDCRLTRECLPEDICACVRDSDCGEGECRDGRCVDLTCEIDAECGPDEECQDGQCRGEACTSDQNCPHVSTHCVSGHCEPHCATDAECGASRVCVQNTCVARRCTHDSHCPVQENECLLGDKDDDGVGDVCDPCPNTPAEECRIPDCPVGDPDCDDDGIDDDVDKCPERPTFLGPDLEYLVRYDTPAYQRDERVGCTVSQRCPCDLEEEKCGNCAEDDDVCTELVKPWRGPKAWRRCVRQMLRATGPHEGDSKRTWKRNVKQIRRSMLDRGREMPCGARERSEGDLDGDRLENEQDNCPRHFNPCQVNDDAESGDTAGNPCDPDDDGDGIPDRKDNCRSVANAGQQDKDGDGVGDACDDCDGTRSDPKHTKPNGCGPCQGENKAPDCRKRGGDGVDALRTP